MSIGDSFIFVDNVIKSSDSVSNLSHIHVMKDALRELNYRNKKLQNRVSYLEEENLKLRSIHKEEAEKNGLDIVFKIGSSYARGGNLWAKGFLNNKEKSQAQPNFFTSKGQFELSMSKQMSSSILKSEDHKVKDDSLEEISLRDGVYGRTGHNSKDRQDGDADEESEYDENNLESIDIALKDIIKAMKKDQEILRQQQEGLKTTLDIFKKVVKENPICKSCLKRDEGTKSKENKIVGTEESLVGRREDGCHLRERIRIPIPTSEEVNLPPLKDRICPLCEKYFHCSTPFDTFNEHVLSHFVEEDEDGEKVPTYDVIT